jgi:alpha-beta hydrolase superfamily lysophospholipase
MRRLCRWCWRRRGRTAGLSCLALLALVNALAYAQARALTHFVDDGGTWRGAEQTSRLEKAGMLLRGPRLPRPVSRDCPDTLGLPYETHTFAGGVGTLEGWYIPCRGATSVVLMFHGFGACKGRMLPDARAWHELGHACFLVDFRGCGGSAGNTTTVGYREADDVARAVAHARQTWPGRRLILFGQSMGSAAILRALGELGVEADAAVLECPFDRMLTTVKVRCRTLGVPAFPAAHLLVFWGGVQHGFDAFAHNPLDYARHVHTPVLLLQGARDSRVQVRDAEAIRANLAGPGELHVFAEVGHESYARRRPREWKETVGAFLAR